MEWIHTTIFLHFLIIEMLFLVILLEVEMMNLQR